MGTERCTRQKMLSYLIQTTWSLVACSAAMRAICGGATALSHVNDAGFWMCSSFLEIDEKTTLKSWTIMETLNKRPRGKGEITVYLLKVNVHLILGESDF